MTAQEKQAVIEQLKAAKHPAIYFETVTEETKYGNSDYDRIIWDTMDTDLIAYVLIDIDAVEEAAYNLGAWVNWKEDTDFLRDQFLRNTDYLNVIEP